MTDGLVVRGQQRVEFVNDSVITVVGIKKSKSEKPWLVTVEDAGELE